MPKLQQPRIHDCIYRTNKYIGLGMYGSLGGGRVCGFKKGLICNFHHAERIEACKFAVKNPNKQYRKE